MKPAWNIEGATSLFQEEEEDDDDDDDEEEEVEIFCC